MGIVAGEVYVYDVLGKLTNYGETLEGAWRMVKKSVGLGPNAEL